MPSHNRIDYIELPATNLEAVKDFYADVFGWTFTDHGPDYVAFKDGSLDGGFFRSEQKSRSAENGAALVVLYSEDMEVTEIEVEAAAGTIVKPIFSFPGGRRFHFHDPAGNELAVWSDK